MTNEQFPDLTLLTTKVTISNDSVDVPYNTHDWNKVDNQNLHDYAIWETVGEEYRLVEIYALSAGLTGSLDFSGCTSLTVLNCWYNQLTELDVSKNTALELLWCDDNQLTTLDVSDCTALVNLGCWGNKLTELDVSKNRELTYLACNNNRLSFCIIESTGIAFR